MKLRFFFVFLHLLTQESAGSNLSGPPSTGASQVSPPPGAIPRPAHAREYNFLDIEIKYGILQVRTHGFFSQYFFILVFSFYWKGLIFCFILNM